MPTLDWIGKNAVVNHHQDVPFHLLRDVPDLGCGPADSGIRTVWVIKDEDSNPRFVTAYPLSAGKAASS